jgi:hypothetical protein
LNATHKAHGQKLRLVTGIAFVITDDLYLVALLEFRELGLGTPLFRLRLSAATTITAHIILI